MKYLLLLTLLILSGCSRIEPVNQGEVIEYFCASDGYWYAKQDGKLIKYGKGLPCVDEKVQ